MKYEDIEVGQTYNINYVDNNYPCCCPCHANASILHCIPCCYDHSYSGPAKCCAKQENGLIDFLVHEWKDEAGWHVVIFPENVLDKVES